MSITFACGSCGKSFTVDDKFAGKKGRCKQCNAVMSIPELAGASFSSDFADDLDEPVISKSRAPIAAPRREPVKAQAKAPANDVYGFDEEPMPARSLKGAPVVASDDDEPAPVMPPRPGLFDTPKSKKKKGHGGFTIGSGVGMIFFRVAIGIGCFLISAIVLPNLRHWTTPGFMSKSQMETFSQKHVQYYNELAAILKTVHDVPSAQAASPQANAKLRAITANMRPIKDAKVVKTEAQEVADRYRFSMDQAIKAAGYEFLRLSANPYLIEALAVQDAAQELENLENSIPGLRKVDFNDVGPGLRMPPPPPPAPTMPNFSPPTQPQPGPQPNPGGAPRPGNRGPNRPGFGRPPR